MGDYRFYCTTCPFSTSDPDGRRGHESYHLSNPRGWLGHGEAHSMTDNSPFMVRAADDGHLFNNPDNGWGECKDCGERLGAHSATGAR